MKIGLKEIKLNGWKDDKYCKSNKKIQHFHDSILFGIN